jgi:acetyltransferase-like isoleucine patch superfamily enzyme
MMYILIILKTYLLVYMSNITKGIGCFIHPSVQIMDGANVTLGDHVYIGENVKIMPGEFSIGDYSKIHSGTLINPKNYIRLGHLAWIGQNSILDGTGGITAGNYLGVGMGSSLYSHIRHGDILEGCNYNQDKPMILGDDVWFVGMCLVSPITAHDKSVAMLGSVITKDMKHNTVYGGNPANILNTKLVRPYKLEVENTNTNKVILMHQFINEYAAETGNSINNIEIVTDEYPLTLDPDVTYYNIQKRTYMKRNTETEINFNKWLFRYKAKFIPNT